MKVIEVFLIIAGAIAVALLAAYMMLRILIWRGWVD